MNKFLKFLMVFIVAASFTVSFVAASDLVMNDFGGKFKALAPEDMTFDNETDDNMITFADGDDYPYYIYTENDEISEATINEFYEGFMGGSDFEIETQDGNMTIFKSGMASIYAISIYTDGKVLVILGEDLNQLKEIAESVEF